MRLQQLARQIAHLTTETGDKTMTQPIAYFGLAFSAPGCCVNGTPSIYAITQRRELASAICDQFYDDPRGFRLAMADLGIRDLWAHVKRHGLSNVFRELNVGRNGEVLCLMGMTESEYEQAAAEYDC